MDRADVLLRQAHESGYRFPPDFRGFTAAFITSTGERGRVVVRGRTEIEVVGEDAAGWVAGEITSMVTHRWATTYDDGDGRWAKRVEADTVALTDDPFDSSYRLRGNLISEVHRTVGGSRFVISVSGRTPAHDGRLLPAHFTVFHWGVDDGRLVKADQFTDSYVLVDGVHLPGRREITSATDAGLTTRWFELADHRVTGDA
jgi:hypothetical protein